MSMLSLPEEIQVYILVRLPVNSILACRCVCKPLCSLLTKPNFIRNHLDRSIQRNKPRLIVDYFRWQKNPKNGMIYSIDYESVLSSSLVSTDLSWCECDCEGAIVMDYPFEYEAGLAWINKKGKKGETVVFKFLGSCDGLICLGISTGTGEFEEDNSVCIWNFATREYKKISHLLCDYVDYKNCYDFLISKDCYNVRYGFGYDSSIEDYKLVRISDYEDTGSFKIEVYTLDSDSWITIQTPVPYSFPADNITHGLLFKGALHWLGITTNQKSSSEVIVSFNVSSERLVDLSFPEEVMPQPSHPYRLVDKNVGVLGNCLCLSVIKTYFYVELWVMQDYEVRESWTKQFKTSTQLAIMQFSSFKPVWCLESGEILIQTTGDFILYDQNNEKARTVHICDAGMGSNQETYVESIVSLKSGTYVEKRERSIDGEMKMPKPQRLRAAKVNVSAYWTDDMEKEFCELLVKQMGAGNVPNLFGIAAWTLVKDEFNRKVGKHLSVPQIKSRYYMLRSRYKEITRFMSSGGLSWDPDEKKVVVDNERVWDAYVKENPDEACYKTLSCPIYEDFCVLFGDIVATKSHAPAKTNGVEKPNLPSKHGSSAFNQEEEVGESSNAECNYRGKQIAPSTSKCGPSKKAASNSAGSNDATTRNYVLAADLQHDPYSIPNCTKHLQSLEGVSIRSIMAAVEKFQDVGWRQVFMSLEPGLQKEWLKSLGS